MTKVTLDNVGSLIDATTAATTINDNSAAIVTAVENTLSRDGTAPNQMESPLDMNSQQILNLPAPSTNLSPLRLTDLESFIGGGTISTVPAGGTTLQALSKLSNADYDMGWDDVVQSVAVSTPADLTVTGSPITGSGTIALGWATPPTGTGAIVRQTSPTLVTPALGTPSAINLANATNMNVASIGGLGAGVATFLGTPSSANLAAAVTGETGTGALVFATSPALVTPALGTPASGVLTSCTGLPISTGVAGLGAGVGTFLATPSSANLATAVTGETGTGALVFGTSPALTTPNIIGTATNDNAAAGSVGELLEATLVSGSATSLVSATAKDITTVSLTAGDWDVSAIAYFQPTATTSMTAWTSSISATTNTLDTTPGRWGQWAGPAQVDANAIAKSQAAGPYRISLASTTTLRLVAFSVFTASTLTCYGYIRARRIR